MSDTRATLQRICLQNNLREMLSTQQIFCLSLYQKITTQCDSLHSLLGPPSLDTFLASIHISETDTYKILKAIDASKSCGPGNIPGRLLHEGAAHLARPLSQLFNLSIQTGTLPTDWKRSNVIPIFKKCSKSSPTNYRPTVLVSLLLL